MTEDRRNPPRAGPVEARETHETRIQRIEKQLITLESAYVALRDELTRCCTTQGDLSTDIALLKRRLESKQEPARYQIREAGE